ncbi:MAG: S1-like domain-containing RNA-binding protein [Rikenellaceae bacterium]
MIKAGRRQTLTVSRISDFGLYLVDDEQNEVLLPNRYVSLSDKEGDTIEVFIYHDSEDRLVATTETPSIMVGEVACLKVVDKNLHGAFLDWGLFGKDLFLPNRNQQGGVIIDRHCIVYAYEDNVTGRCVATSKLKGFISNDALTIDIRQEVNILIASESEIGYRVIINNRHWGMIYRNQIFKKVNVGDRMKAFVRRITEDNRIDLTLQQQGYKEVKNSAETLYDLMMDNGGELPINDNSDPAKVTQYTEMSKKLFKRSLGVLLKRGDVEATESGIRIIKNSSTNE